MALLGGHPTSGRNETLRATVGPNESEGATHAHEGATMKKPIICLDFDGVVHSYVSGWQGPRNIPDPPVEGAINFMLEAQSLGYEVVIHSSRARYFGGISAMRKWLRRHAGMAWYEAGFGDFEGLEMVRFTRWKPPALVTIDDRAIRFDGKFPNPKEAASLPTWTKASRI